MKQLALIYEGRVVEIVDEIVLVDGQEVPLEARYHPDVVACMVAYDPNNPPPPPPEVHPLPTTDPAAPHSVTMRQARLALLSLGKLAAVDAAIASLPSPHREAAQIEWDYSATVERSSTIVTTLGPLLNLDNAALDALFLKASTL